MIGVPTSGSIKKFSEKERIKIAKTTFDVELQRTLARDLSNKVKIALMENPNFFEEIIFEILSEDCNEEIKEKVKEYYMHLIDSDSNIRSVYIFSKIIFGEIPKVYNEERRKTLMSFLYLLTKKYSFNGYPSSYIENRFTPFSRKLDIAINKLTKIYKMIPDIVEEKVVFTIESYVAEFKNTLFNSAPENLAVDEWISLLGEIYFKYFSTGLIYIFSQKKIKVLANQNENFLNAFKLLKKLIPIQE